MSAHVLATVVSGDEVTAPLGGGRAAVVVVEALRGDEVIATMILGDLLRLRAPAGEVELVARRARFRFTSLFEAPWPSDRLAPVPPELVPLLQRGATAFRERLVRRGDRLRIRVGTDGVEELEEVVAFSG